MPYTILRSGSLAGGLAEFGEQYQAGDVILYIASDDIEADLKQIEAAGGKPLCPPVDVDDPSSNRLALWQDKQPAS